MKQHDYYKKDPIKYHLLELYIFFCCSQNLPCQKVNVNSVRIPKNLNCKSKNIVYMWVCTLCKGKEVYFGRTTQQCRNRISGHRKCFNDEKYDKSALSMQAREVHQTNFSLDVSKNAVVSKVSPQRLRREEFRYIEKYRANYLGLKRCKVWLQL